MHTPPAESHFMWAGGQTTPFPHSSILSIHTQRQSLPSPHAQAGILHYFPHAASWGGIFLPSTISLWRSHYQFLLWGCVSVPILWSVYMFFPAQAESLITSSISGCVFPIVSVLRSGLLFSPRFVVWCGFFFVLVCCGYYWVVLATIGPRTTQESYFPTQAVNRLFCYVYAVVGLRTVLAWLICWWPDKPNCVGLLNCVFLAMCKPACSLFLGKWCLAWGC